MAGKGPSPLLGYNTNVRRKGVLCHVQTEDSGIAHPHVITHVFTAGTIIGTRKRSYKEHVGGEGDLEPKVRKLMQDQHKAMCIALRDGEFDSNLPISDTTRMEPYRDTASPSVPRPTTPADAPAAAQAIADAEAEIDIELDDDVTDGPRAGTPTPPFVKPPSDAQVEDVEASGVRAKETKRSLTPVPPVPDTKPKKTSASKPPVERPQWVAEIRETPPPPSMVQSKPQLPADTTYKERGRESPPAPPPRGSRTPVPATKKRVSTVPPPPRPVTPGRRAPTEPPATTEDGAGRYSSKAPTLFASKRGPTPPPPPPAAKETRRPATPRSSIFGQEYISEKSLDEVILAYLSEEMDDK